MSSFDGIFSNQTSLFSFYLSCFCHSQHFITTFDTYVVARSLFRCSFSLFFHWKLHLNVLYNLCTPSKIVAWKRVFRLSKWMNESKKDRERKRAYMNGKEKLQKMVTRTLNINLHISFFFSFSLYLIIIRFHFSNPSYRPVFLSSFLKIWKWIQWTSLLTKTEECRKKKQPTPSVLANSSRFSI